MINIFHNAAAFVLPVCALAAAGMAAVGAFASQQKTVVVTDRRWTRVYGTPADPQSRGTTG
jgi:hypothetical protein